MLALRMVEEQFHRDVEDRPIREGRMPPELQRPDEIEYRTCPHAGSRHLHANPMNVSAVRQTSAHWDEIVDALAVLRAAYTDAVGGYRCELMDVWRVSQLGSALPWFFILRDGVTCPAYAAALAKATLGVGIWGQHVFVEQLARRELPAPLTAQDMADSAEHTGTLISDAEVCSASSKMLLRFFDVLVGEPATDAGHLTGLANRRDEILRFGAVYLGFKQWLWLYSLARRFLYADLVASLGPRPELVELLDAGVEPPDFFLAEPSAPATVPLAHRAVWFHGLAQLVLPFAPDGRDRALRTSCERLALVMGEGAIIEPVGRALAMFAALDTLHGEVIAIVEVGFGGEPPSTIDADTRDRFLRASPRAMLARLTSR